MPREFKVHSNNKVPTTAAELRREAISALSAGELSPVSPQGDAANHWFAFKKVSKRDGGSAKNKSAGLHAEPHTLDPLADPRWAAFIEGHPRASIFHTVPWLEALRRTYGYRPIVYTTSPPGAPLLNGIVFCRVESLITGRRLVSLPFSDHCEPLVESSRELERIVTNLEVSGASRHWKYVELRPTGQGMPASSSLGSFVPADQFYLHTIDLRPDEADLLKSFHESSVQRRIRRAIGEGLHYESGRSEALYRKFYDLFVLTRRRHHAPPQPEKWFRSLIASMGDAVEIHVASHGDKPVAAILTLRFKKTVSYKYGASDSTHKKYAPMPFLLWRAMQAAKSNGAEVFDLGRSDFEDRGLIAFKDHWGGERTELRYWRSPAHPQGVLWNAAYRLQLAKSLFGVMPAPILRLAGQLLYRHIG